jgi:hypothetical protein
VVIWRTWTEGCPKLSSVQERAPFGALFIFSIYTRSSRPSTQRLPERRAWSIKHSRFSFTVKEMTMQVKALFAAALLGLLPSTSQATHLMYMPFETVLSDAIRAGRLDGSVKFYLAGNGPQGTQRLLQRGVVSDLRTNGFNKSDHDSCEWVLQSNLIKLQADAKRAGANAVTNIVSYYDQHARKDLNTYECRAGVFATRVALKGDLVRLP